MTIARFDKVGQEPQYLEWRRNNKDGFVLNTNAKTPVSKSVNKIHRADYCQSLDDPRYVGRMTTPEHVKLCSVDMDVLIKEMTNQGLPWSSCGLCKP